MQFPESFLEVAKKMVAKYSDPEKTISETEKVIRKLPEFESLVNSLVREAIAEMVYEMRHLKKRVMKREAGEYGRGSVYASSRGSATDHIYESIYNMPFAGTFLGLIKGEELLGIAEKEKAIAEGHLENAEIAIQLSRVVKPGQMVQEALSERKLKLLVSAICKKKQKEEAA